MNIGPMRQCPCGSERPISRCCYKLLLEVAEEVLVGTLRFAAERWGEELLEDAWYEYKTGRFSPDGTGWRGGQDRPMLGDGDCDALFVPWFAFHHVPAARSVSASELIAANPRAAAHPHDRRQDWPASPAAVEWLVAQGDEADPLTWRYVETAVRSPLSVFMVERIECEWSADLTDVLTGARFHALQAYPNTDLTASYLIWGSVLTIDGICLLHAVSTSQYCQDWLPILREWRARVVPTATTRRGLLENARALREQRVDMAHRFMEVSLSRYRQSPTAADVVAATTDAVNQLAAEASGEMAGAHDDEISTLLTPAEEALFAQFLPKGMASSIHQLLDHVEEGTPVEPRRRLLELAQIDAWLDGFERRSASESRSVQAVRLSIQRRLGFGRWITERKYKKLGIPQPIPWFVNQGRPLTEGWPFSDDQIEG